ncbi:MAG TPA: peptidoglycan editing factor PgeF [Syntrophales bacterium]|nr:peptidoglycan editing factor PgeF [Syntrophales bacterium]
MFRLLERGRVCYLESARLKENPFLTHAFLTRWSGVSTGKFSSLNLGLREGDKEERVARNWRLIADAFGLSVSQFFPIDQVHGDRIVVVEDLQDETSPVRCDAVLTARRGVALAVKTADCVPLLLVDREKQVVGVVHAGWRGTALGIAAKAVKTLKERFDSKPADILAAIGPAVGACCYQVDGKVYDAFKKLSAVRERAFRACQDVEGRWMLDLESANIIQLVEAGIPRENIFSAALCTSCRRDLFFSHRAERGGTGRHLSFIVLN